MSNRDVKQSNIGILINCQQLNEVEKSIARTSRYMENIATQYSASRMYIRAPVSKFRAGRSGRASTYFGIL